MKELKLALSPGCLWWGINQIGVHLFNGQTIVNKVNIHEPSQSLDHDLLLLCPNLAL